jgi:tetratricopeptide (TPR) repeat protein
MGKKKAKGPPPAPVPTFYLSTTYADNDSPVRLPRAACTCWRNIRDKATCEVCIHSPRNASRHYVVTRAPFSPDRVDLSPRLERLKLEVAAAGGQARSLVNGERFESEATVVAPKGSRLADLDEDRLGALLARYTDAIERDKLLGFERPEVFVRRAALLSAAGEHERAKRDAQVACRLVPTLAVAHFRLGVAEFELGRYEAAVAAFAEGLKASPGSCDLQRAREAALVALRARPGRLEALHAASKRREREANEMTSLKINKLTAAKAAARKIKDKATGRPSSRASSR